MSDAPPKTGENGSNVESSGSDGRVSPTPAVVAVLALLSVPMTVVPSGTGDLTLVTLWGFVNTGAADPSASHHLYPVWSYFGDQTRPFRVLPASIRAWPLALGFHLIAVASVLLGRGFGREDVRVTGGVLVLGALSTLWVTVGVASRFGVGGAAGLLTVVPVGTIATLSVVIVWYRRDLVRIVR